MMCFITIEITVMITLAMPVMVLKMVIIGDHDSDNGEIIRMIGIVSSGNNDDSNNNYADNDFVICKTGTRTTKSMIITIKKTINGNRDYGDLNMNRIITKLIIIRTYYYYYY